MPISSYGQQHVSHSLLLSLLAAAAAGWLAQRQINTSVHESCSPHTPKTIAGGLCAGRPGLLSSQSAHTGLLFVSWRCLSEQIFKKGRKSSLCIKVWGLMGAMSLHEDGNQKQPQWIWMGWVYRGHSKPNDTGWGVNRRWAVYSLVIWILLKRCTKKAQREDSGAQILPICIWVLSAARETTLPKTTTTTTTTAEVNLWRWAVAWWASWTQLGPPGETAMAPPIVPFFLFLAHSNTKKFSYTSRSRTD